MNRQKKIEPSALKAEGFESEVPTELTNDRFEAAMRVYSFAATLWSFLDFGDFDVLFEYKNPLVRFQLRFQYRDKLYGVEHAMLLLDFERCDVELMRHRARDLAEKWIDLASKAVDERDEELQA